MPFVLELRFLFQPKKTGWGMLGKESRTYAFIYFKVSCYSINVA